jgi:PIN domain nuclease of toxin-antitoxin system
MGRIDLKKIPRREAQMSQPILLDTFAAILAAEDQLPPSTAELLTRCYNDDVPLFLSPITAWELGILLSRGRLRISRSAFEYFRQISSLPGVELAAMPPQLLLASSFLPGAPPSDPVDRILAATAREYGYTLMTRDRALLAYAQEGHLHAIAC